VRRVGSHVAVAADNHLLGLTSASTPLELSVKDKIASILLRPQLEDRAHLAALVTSQHERVRGPAQLEPVVVVSAVE
jgi:hypothetical protein